MTEMDAGFLARMKRERTERNAEQRRQAVECRGPWWWRARCRLADLLIKAGAALDPPDRATAGWIDDDGMFAYADVRRPEGCLERNRTAAEGDRRA